MLKAKRKRTVGIFSVRTTVSVNGFPSHTTTTAPSPPRGVSLDLPRYCRHHGLLGLIRSGHLPSVYLFFTADGCYCIRVILEATYEARL